MCRLFAMTGGRAAVSATFWLLEAPDSLVAQSRRNPDGTGLGWFDTAGAPHVDKQAMAGYEDADFAREARDVHARTILAHVRYASTGGVSDVNTHPFAMRGRLFAHNGALESLLAVEKRIDPEVAKLIRGDTDSERLFALITSEIERAGDDVGAGIKAAVRWLAAEAELFALNFILITPDELWALRYPAVHDLLYLRAEPGDGSHRSDAGRIAVDAPGAPAYVAVASEPMDEEGWQPLAGGDLLHVDADLTVTVTQIVDEPPAHQLTLADLSGRAQASQGAA